MTETLREILPAVYARLLPDFFDRPAPHEVKATCSSCAMCPSSGARTEGVVHFQPSLKCCTYHPTLPNYLVGAVLADADARLDEGKRRLRDKIAQRTGVTPLWIAAPRKYSLLLEASRENAFGRSAALECPYYESDGGLCTIWKHRDADCTTFFCKYVAGLDGRTFWRSFDRYLRIVERALAEHATRTIAPELEEVVVPPGKLTLEDAEGLPPAQATYASMWGAWRGREAELYERSHAVVASMTAADFERALASRAADLDALTAAYRAATEPQLPARLAWNPDNDVTTVDDGVVVVSYSRYEPTHLNAELYAVLQEFSERESVADVRARIQRDRGVHVGEELLVSMYQLRILVDPPPPGDRGSP